MLPRLNCNKKLVWFNLIFLKVVIIIMSLTSLFVNSSSCKPLVQNLKQSINDQITLRHEIMTTNSLNISGLRSCWLEQVGACIVDVHISDFHLHQHLTSLKRGQLSCFFLSAFAIQVRSHFPGGISHRRGVFGGSLAWLLGTEVKIALNYS